MLNSWSNVRDGNDSGRPIPRQDRTATTIDRLTELSGQHCFNGLDERALGLAALDRLDNLTVNEEL